MHHGVCNAKDLLKASTAKTKVIIVLSDGRANRTKDNIEQHNRDNARKKVKEELEEAKKEINNLQVAIIHTLFNVFKILSALDKFLFISSIILLLFSLIFNFETLSFIWLTIGKKSV